MEQADIDRVRRVLRQRPKPPLAAAVARPAPAPAAGRPPHGAVVAAAPAATGGLAAAMGWAAAA
jgi:hypothetical protein